MTKKKKAPDPQAALPGIRMGDDDSDRFEKLLLGMREIRGLALLVDQRVEAMHPTAPEELICGTGLLYRELGSLLDGFETLWRPR